MSHRCEDFDFGAYCPVHTFNFSASNGIFVEERINGVTYRSINETLGYFKEADDSQPSTIF